ncbi:hypothetical protein DNHGIG_23890 [Collibacillus ludicampi]|uniref:Transposase n=1 Tax=Collibacillus ludicampi TaxID=2771369 RepID=A0AAV4LG95_9BACL|nr:hypothetical protein [Collibacillus ludicampi]GIM46840.1 hypothetical protein DNHGIG_23890 [Collibacillus ludicampi]
MRIALAVKLSTVNDAHVALIRLVELGSGWVISEMCRTFRCPISFAYRRAIESGMAEARLLGVERLLVDVTTDEHPELETLGVERLA